MESVCQVTPGTNLKRPNIGNVDNDDDNDNVRRHTSDLLVLDVLWFQFGLFLRGTI
jgi:hypothetical protein